MSNDKLMQQAQQLHANGKLSAKQIEALQEMDEGQRTMIRALMDAMEMAPPAPEEEPVEENGEPAAAAGDYKENSAVTNHSAGMTNEQLDQLVANRVQEQMRRVDVTNRLRTNERNPFSEDEMRTMSVDHLEKLEQSIRPQDYSGQGGFAANSDAVDTNVQPLTIHKGAIRGKTAKQ